MQKRLAAEVTRWVHGQAELDKAMESAQILFGKPDLAKFEKLPEDELLDIFEGVPIYEISQPNQDDLLTALSAGTEGKLFLSKGEARKFIQQGALSLNLQKVMPEHSLGSFTKIAGKYIAGQRGKKNWFLLKLE